MLFWILIWVCIGAGIVVVLIVIVAKFTYRKDDDNLRQLNESIHEQDNEPPTATN